MNKTALLSGYKAYKIEQVIETFFFFKKLAAGSVRIDSHAASQPGGGGWWILLAHCGHPPVDDSRRH